MKMSLCKVHLGMFQYCLDIPQLLNSSLMEQRPRRPGAPRAQCPPWVWPAGAAAGGERTHASPHPDGFLQVSLRLLLKTPCLHRPLSV